MATNLIYLLQQINLRVYSMLQTLRLINSSFHYMKIKISLYDFVWGRNSAYITALYCSYIRRIPRLGYLGIDHKFRLQGEVGGQSKLFSFKRQKVQRRRHSSFNMDFLSNMIFLQKNQICQDNHQKNDFSTKFVLKNQILIL